MQYLHRVSAGFRHQLKVAMKWVAQNSSSERHQDFMNVSPTLRSIIYMNNHFTLYKQKHVTKRSQLKIMFGLSLSQGEEKYKVIK